MNVVTISKGEYQKLQREQKYLRSEILQLRQIVQKVVIDEITPTTVKRLVGRSQDIDKGGGIRFSSALDVKKYLRTI